MSRRAQVATQVLGFHSVPLWKLQIYIRDVKSFDITWSHHHATYRVLCISSVIQQCQAGFHCHFAPSGNGFRVAVLILRILSVTLYKQWYMHDDSGWMIPVTILKCPNLWSFTLSGLQLSSDSHVHVESLLSTYQSIGFRNTSMAVMIPTVSNAAESQSRLRGPICWSKYSYSAHPVVHYCMIIQ